jgi:hypothetical protein
MNLLITILAGIAGAVIGAFLGVAVAAALAPMLGISSFEGASGYFAVFIGGPIGVIVGIIAGVVLASRFSGVRSGGAIAGRFGLVVVVILGLIVAGLAYMWLDRDLVTTSGPPPKLAFEIRLPSGAALPAQTNDIVIHLDSAKNHMPATLFADQFRRDGDRPVIIGSVDVVYRESTRLLVLRLPNQPDQIFNVRIGKDPRHAKELGPWQRVDHVFEAGQSTGRRATAADNYEVRYRAVWAGED